ncbi:YhgE/Pip domain-containing protein [Fictibacillus fluitans]|uniref:YhgE/Pip domain-containing protein n=1 Tax=Fictibacillus fluitans TaxID=3058422 RepID=A0ABT8I1L4_9BACL|nr:YhgE/Pip domain-containing protein [Fictibacillus sp. NE201]MDN4526923.1 YhgE/Pip domain-containing protein [Fictibacillus sp. NE201]
MVWKQFQSVLRNPKLLIPVAAILFIPILYAGIYLWAFWDPYSHTDQLPVAVVNEDKGAVMDGEKLRIGDDLVKELKDNPDFKWEFVGKQQAERGLKENKYYAVIEVPDNFSKKAKTAMDPHPDKLQLKYKTNSGYNYLASQIGQKGVQQLENKLSNKISKTYTGVIFDQIGKMGDGFQKASEGAGKLAQGSSKASAGSHDLAKGTGTLSNKTKDLESGLGELEGGSSQLSSGLKASKDGTDKLYAGMNQKTSDIAKLNNGAGQLTKGTNSLAAGLGELNEKGSQITSGQEQSAEGAKELKAGADAAYAGAATLDEKGKDLLAGAERLKTGGGKLSEGASSLKGGADQTAAGAEKVSNGLSSLKADLEKNPDMPKAEIMARVAALEAGSQQVSQGTQKVAAGALPIKQGADELAAGADQLEQGQSKFQQGVESLHAGQRKLVDGLDQLASGQQKLLDGTKTFMSKIGEAKNGADQLAAGSAQVTEGTGSLAKGWPALVENVGKLSEGQSKLAQGSIDLTQGIQTAKDGSGKLSEGALELNKGAGSLASGVDSIQSGNKELAGELHKAADKAEKAKATDDGINMISNPVKTLNASTVKDMTYGTGLAPYFLSLGLFVGALMLTIVFPLIEPAVKPKNAFSWFFSKYVFMAVTGILQALIADLILIKGLDLDVQSTGRFIVFSIIISLTFMAIIQFLVSSMGNPGRFIVILMLIFQLTSSGGTFPTEMIPSSLQTVHAFMPMSYSIAGLRAVITTGDYSLMWQNAIILGYFMVPMLAASLLFFTFKMKKFRNGENAANTI